MQASILDHACAQHNSVQCCVAWLDRASAALNPDGAAHHCPSTQALHAFKSGNPPPPPLLQEQWSTQVWAMPGEPYDVYLLRCLAHAHGVTRLSPHFACDLELQSTEDVEFTAPPRGAGSLFAAHCVVAGIRVEPAASNLMQTGWDTQPCPHCAIPLHTADGAVDGVECQPRRALLPLLYGGDTCESCGRAFPLRPAWTRVVYLVLQRRDRTRAAAVAYGDGILRHLFLGAAVHALLYCSQTEQRESLLVVHAAAPSVAVPLDVPRGVAVHNNTTTSASLTRVSENYFQDFYDEAQTSALCKKWASPCCSLGEVAQLISPKLLGQTHAKQMVLLTVLYTLYGAQRCVRAAKPRRPLHLLLLGPAKSGKSALLSGVRRIMGARAEVLDATVVRSRNSGGGGGGRRSDDGASFLAALPTRQGGILFAGPALTVPTVVLHRLPSSAAAAAVAPLHEVLERQQGCLPDGCDVDGATGQLAGPFSAQVVHLPVHVIAAAGGEDVGAVELAPSFALVGALTPASTLDESALISQDVVAAVRARASSSRASASRSRSSSASSSSITGSQTSAASPTSATSPSPPSPLSQRGCSLRRSHGASVAAPEWLTEVDLQYLLHRTAGPAELCAAADAAVCHAAYLPRLIAAAGLVEEAQRPVSACLPPPAACRWTRLTRYGSASCAEATAHLSATPLSYDRHLRVLQSLSQARLMLESAADVAARGLTREMCEEVWQLYQHHLVTLADLLHQGSPNNNSNDVNSSNINSAALMCRDAPAQAVDVQNVCPAGGISWGPRPTNGQSGRGGGPMRKLSKKQVLLCFVEELRCLQSRKRDALSPAELQHLYAQKGGRAVFGDPLDVVLTQLQAEGFMLRQLGGWRVL